MEENMQKDVVFLKMTNYRPRSYATVFPCSAKNNTKPSYWIDFAKRDEAILPVGNYPSNWLISRVSERSLEMKYFRQEP